MGDDLLIPRISRRRTHPAAQEVLANWAGMAGRPKEGMAIFGSVGGMYAAVAYQIFGDASLAGNVMALAAYGLPSLPTDHFFNLTDAVLTFSEVVPRSFEHDRR